MTSTAELPKYFCTNCQEDIRGIRVHCAECTEPDFYLCLQCFAAGAEIGEHKTDHKYQFLDSGVLSIFPEKSGWSEREILHLLNAIELYGFGNWEDISKHIETRSPEDAKEEYINKFLNGTIGRYTWRTSLDQRPKLNDHTLDDSGPLSSSLSQRLPPLEVSSEEAESLNFMPHRNDFEHEYDPTAESLVSGLSLSPEDEEVDLVLKLAHVDIYTRRLRERARRKRLLRDYQLVANFFRGSQRRSRQTRDQREFRDRFRVVAQFYTAHEFERLVASIERERYLRTRLSELYRYRWNGLTRFEECVHFEQHAAAAQHRNTGPFGNGRTLSCIIGPNGHRVPGCMRQCLTGQPSQWRTAPVVYALSKANQNRAKELRDMILNKNRENERPASSSSIDQKSMHPIGDPASYDVSSHNKNSSDSCRVTGPLQPQQQQQPLNQQQLPSDPAQQLGGDLLSKNEIQLCNTLNLPPTRYISLKTVLLNDVPIASTEMNNQETAIKNYLIKAGWLKAGES